MGGVSGSERLDQSAAGRGAGSVNKTAVYHCGRSFEDAALLRNQSTSELSDIHRSGIL